MGIRTNLPAKRTARVLPSLYSAADREPNRRDDEVANTFDRGNAALNASIHERQRTIQQLTARLERIERALHLESQQYPW